MTKLKAAILGYGRSGGSLHAGALEANKELFDVVAACDVNPEQLTAANKRFGCRTYDDYHKMISAERPDVVIIVTRSDQHAAMVCDCLAEGANVLVTKPWCVNASEARRMMAAEKASGKMLLPWLPARWSSDMARVREIIKSGRLGEVFLIRRAETTFSLRCDWQIKTEFGGGYLLNWGPHIVDTATLAAGGKAKTVYARLRKTVNPGDAEDIFYALINMDNGCVVTAEYTHSARRLPNWLVQGTMGTLVVEDGNKLTIYHADKLPPPNPANYGTAIATETTTETIGGESYGDQNQIYRDIAAALRGEKPYPVRPQDAYELTCLFDAIKQSNRENRLVEYSPK